MASNYFKTLLQRQLHNLTRTLSSEAVWLVPAGLGAGWLLWPCLDLEWKMQLGLAKNPEADMFRVQELKQQRYEAKFGKPSEEKEEEEEIEEEEADAEEEEAPGKDLDEDRAAGIVDAIHENHGEDDDDDDDDDAGEGKENDGDDDEDGDEDDEEHKIVVPPLYVPTKGNLTSEQVWDNYTIKMVNWLADDDDDDEDEDDEE